MFKTELKISKHWNVIVKQYENRSIIKSIMIFEFRKN